MDKKDIVVVDLDCDSDEEMLPLRERLARTGHNESPSRFKKRSSSVHKVSSSEDSNSSESLPDPSCFLTESELPIAIINSVDNNAIRDDIICDPMPEKYNEPEVSSSNHCSTSSSSDEITKLAKKPTRKRSPAKMIDADKRLEERERKRQAKVLEKALKAVEKDIKRSAKPEECIKSIRLSFDSGFTDLPGAPLVYNILLDSEVTYTHQEHAIPLSVQWYRRVAEVDVVGNQVQKKEKDQLEESLLVYVPPLLFCDLVYAYSQKCKGKQNFEQTILEYIINIQDSSPQMKLTCITVGLDSYLGRKGEGLKDAEVGGGVLSQRNKCVFKKDVDEAVTTLNVEAHITYYSLKDMEEFGKLLTRLTKAIAEAPFKRDKQSQQHQAFSWYAQADSSRPVKVEKDGKGFINLWQQQLLQFQNVGKETAQAIAAKFPSPYLLVQAYKQCSSQKEAENLLKDIVVRRDYGPLSSTRKVGPELSYKICRFFTSHDGSELLQR